MKWEEGASATGPQQQCLEFGVTEQGGEKGKVTFSGGTPIPSTPLTDWGIDAECPN